MVSNAILDSADNSHLAASEGTWTSLALGGAKVKVEFRPYRRQFQRSLLTHHGKWSWREGIILRLSSEAGEVGFGEIAPLSWFGSESFEQALDFCRQLPTEITETISIPSTLPACQFGWESAWQAMSLTQPEVTLPYCGLLPTGEAALQAWQELWSQGYRTFKWKIGTAPLQDEMKLGERLTAALPKPAKLRLDANGGLSEAEAHEWLQVCDRVGIEFLEQPLPTHQLGAMLQLSNQYATPLALDESVATLKQLHECYQQGWRGIFVIKPAIAGSPYQLRQFCQAYAIDAVFSSVFETAIGRQAALQLAAELSRSQRAVGFGIDHWFAANDALEQPMTFEQLWQSL